MAVAILTTIFVFPETMCHAQMDTLAAQLARVQRLVEMQDDVLTAPPEELAPDAPLIAQFKALRAQVIGTQRQCAFSSSSFSISNRNNLTQ
jgi:hypothetical protein